MVSSTNKPPISRHRFLLESCREDEEENDNDDKSVDENEGGDAENNNGDDSYNDKLPPKKRVKAKGSRSAHLPTTVMEVRSWSSFIEDLKLFLGDPPPPPPPLFLRTSSRIM